MRRRRNKFDIYLVIFLAVLTAGYFTYDNISSGRRGVEAYELALQSYKDADFENAYQEFGRVPASSCLKEAALFRQGRSATNLGKKELAIKKYNRIVHSKSKSSILPISEYNMANLMYEIKDKRAKKFFNDIIKKYPTSDYAIASHYFLGLLELENLPENEKQKNKAKTRAFNYFKNYILNSPNGRYSLKCVDEILKLGVNLNNYDNLLIARTYYQNGEYENSKDFLNKTTLAESWVDFARTEYRLGNKEKTRYYVELGLKEHAETFDQQDVFEAIDNYIASYPTKREGIQELLNKKYKSTGADYIAYLNCSELVKNDLKPACYGKMYEQYPNGQFSAEALYNLIISKYLQKDYLEAQRLGTLHLKTFPDVKSTPAVMYYMGKISGKLKYKERSDFYYKSIMKKYPDNYYAFRANYNLYKADGALPFDEITSKPVVFPYKKSLDENLVVNLAHLKDYDLVEELCKKDKFIQSWVAYQKGNYTISVLLARNAMEELSEKPDFDDLRWRLVYPLHYYDVVNKYKNGNNPIILEAIVKEESHFNPYAQSCAGASGLMQLMPVTYSEIVKGRGIGTDMFLPENSIQAGSIYYSNLKKVLGNKDLYAISAYNGGIGSVQKWFSKLSYSDTDEFVEQIPYQETKNYLKKVLRTYWVYGNVY